MELLFTYNTWVNRNEHQACALLKQAFVQVCETNIRNLVEQNVTRFQTCPSLAFCLCVIFCCFCLFHEQFAADWYTKTNIVNKNKCMTENLRFQSKNIGSRQAKRKKQKHARGVYRKSFKVNNRPNCSQKTTNEGRGAVLLSHCSPPGKP